MCINKKTPLYLYIHLPFCIKKCAYCNFYSIDRYNNKYYADYLNALLKEINFYFDNFNMNEYELKSIYLGGGTPSLFPLNLLYILINQIFKRFSLSENPEITIEINPETFNIKKAIFYKSIGINRISLGIQSFNPNFRKILGRISNNKSIYNSLYILKKFFSNFSMDLIYGIPYQEKDDLNNELFFINKFEPTHVSYYGLIVYENSAFYKRYRRIFISEDYNDRFSNLYLRICDFLKSRGYIHYEVSNFSKIGFESKHNIAYWEFEEYLGIGASASSFFKGKRFTNPSNIIEYIKNPINRVIDKRSINDELMEKIFLSLRYYKGLNLKDYNITKEKLNEIPDDYFFIDKGRMILTDKGYLLSNEIALKVFDIIDL